MNIVVGEHFEKFIHNQISLGNYKDASEIVREGLRLVEEREAKINSLRVHINSAIERGGSYGDQEISEILEND